MSSFFSMLASLALFLHPPYLADRHSEAGCLAQMTYYEQRGRSVESKAATAHVALKRATHPEFPSTICAAISHKNAFSYRPLLKKRPPFSTEEWRKSVEISLGVLEGRIPDPTEDALFFCNPKTATRGWCRKAKGPILDGTKYVSMESYIKATRPTKFRSLPR